MFSLVAFSLAWVYQTTHSFGFIWSPLHPLCKYMGQILICLLLVYVRNMAFFHIIFQDNLFKFFFFFWFKIIFVQDKFLVSTWDIPLAFLNQSHAETMLSPDCSLPKVQLIIISVNWSACKYNGRFAFLVTYPSENAKVAIRVQERFYYTFFLHIFMALPPHWYVFNILSLWLWGQGSGCGGLYIW